MALWQYGFLVLPKDAKNERFVSIDGEFDDSVYWIPKKTPLSFFNSVDGILKKGKSWSKNRDLYGDQEGNNLEVLFENDIVISVNFRIDYRTNYEPILSQLLDFIKSNNLIIVDEQLSLVPSNNAAITTTIRSSPQYAMYIQLTK